MTISRTTLLKMLRFALIEIRASGDIEECRQIADIFHTLPSALASGRPDEELEDVYSQMAQKADRYNRREYLKNLRTSAES